LATGGMMDASGDFKAGSGPGNWQWRDAAKWGHLE